MLEAFIMMDVEKEKLASLDHDEIINLVPKQSDVPYTSLIFISNRKCSNIKLITIIMHVHNSVLSTD